MQVHAAGRPDDHPTLYLYAHCADVLTRRQPHRPAAYYYNNVLLASTRALMTLAHLSLHLLSQLHWLGTFVTDEHHDICCY